MKHLHFFSDHSELNDIFWNERVIIEMTQIWLWLVCGAQSV